MSETKRSKILLNPYSTITVLLATPNKNIEFSLDLISGRKLASVK